MTELAKTGFVRSVVLVGYDKMAEMLGLPAGARVVQIVDLSASQLTEGAGIVVEHETIYPAMSGFPYQRMQRDVGEITEMVEFIDKARKEKP